MTNLEASWDRLCPTSWCTFGTTGDSVLSSSAFQPCPRRLHTTCIVHPEADGSEPSDSTTLLVIFGGKTAVATLPDHVRSAAASWAACYTTASPAAQTPTEVYLSDVACFHIASRTWLQVVSSSGDGALPAPRAYHAAASTSSMMIVTGGKSSAGTGTQSHRLRRDRVLGDVWRCRFHLHCADGDMRVSAQWTSMTSLADASDHLPQCYHASMLQWVPRSIYCGMFGLDPETTWEESTDQLCAPVVLCTGGNDGEVLDDTVRVFGIAALASPGRHTTTSSRLTVKVFVPTPRLATVTRGRHREDAGRLESATLAPHAAACEQCGVRYHFCNHKSDTISSVAMKNRLRSRVLSTGNCGIVQKDTECAHTEKGTHIAQKHRCSSSVPPRDGHSMIALPASTEPRRSGVEGWAGIDLLLFGGEVCLTAYNTVIRLQLRSNQETEVCRVAQPTGSPVSISWSVAAGGPEYHPRCRGSPARCVESPSWAAATPQQDCQPVVAHGTLWGCPGEDVEEPCCHSYMHNGSEEDGEPAIATCSSTAAALCSRARIVVSESPERSGQECQLTTSSASATSAATAAPQHRAFHCSWPCGSTGLLVYGGVRRDTLMQSLYFYDTLQSSWHEVHSTSGGHPGARVVTAACANPHSHSASDRDAMCLLCGAPSEVFYLVGGESEGGALENDVWSVSLHYRGCMGMKELRSVTGMRPPVSQPSTPVMLTPPPKRRLQQHRSVSSSNSDTSSSGAFLQAALEPTYTLLPLKTLLGLFVKSNYPEISSGVFVKSSYPNCSPDSMCAKRTHHT